VPFRCRHIVGDPAAHAYNLYGHIGAARIHMRRAITQMRSIG
jgi:hypothetical protein